jgi:hypothetical protein
MKWNHLSVDAEMGLESFPCPICGRSIRDLIFWPKMFEDLETLGLREDTGICENCMFGIEDELDDNTQG